MTARVFIYGKGTQFSYGVEKISPSLEPFRQELVHLSGYGNRDQGKSIRYGTLSNGDPYLSLAFALPEGGAWDARQQIRVFTFVFAKTDVYPLSPDLLARLSSLTMEDVESLPVRDGKVEVDRLLFAGRPTFSSAEPPSRNLTVALLATLFYQKEKGGRPALLARVSPDELLASLAQLPPWLLGEVSFNTDVRSVSEPLQLANAWTAEAKQNAERSNYSGGDLDQRYFFFPAEEETLVHIGGLEQEARYFLTLSPTERDQLFLDCGEDVPTLIARLGKTVRWPDGKEAPNRKGKKLRDRHQPPSPLPQDLGRWLTILLLELGLMAMVLVVGCIPPDDRLFILRLSTDALVFPGIVFLIWAIFSLAEDMVRAPLWTWLRTLRAKEAPDNFRRLQRVYQGCVLLAVGVPLALLVYSAVAGRSNVIVRADTITVTLQLWGGWSALLAGAVVGVLAWGSSLLYRLARNPAPRQEEPPC